MILVVGATGDLGRRVCRQLHESGHRVRVMTRSPERAREAFGSAFETVVGDLLAPDTLPQALDGVDTVVHCATGRTTRFDWRNNPRAVDDRGTASLVSAAAESGARRIVYISALGAGPEAPTETLRMKYRAEWHVLHSGMHFTILRPSLFVEDWIEPLSKRVLEGKLAAVPAVRSTPISWVSAEDVARLVVLSLTDRDLEDRTVDVAGSSPTTLDTVIAAMERSVGRRVSRAYVPGWVLFVGSVMTSLVDPRLSERLASGWALVTRPECCDAAGLQRTIPAWRPTSVEQLAAEFVRQTT